MQLIDTHCHLQHPAFDEDRAAVLDRALGELAWLVGIGDTIETSQQAIDLARERVYATVGIHPHNAHDATDGALAAIRELAQAPGVVALGEIGLDYHYDYSPRDRQQKALCDQLAMAVELGLPVVFHCREAHEDWRAIVEPFHRDLRAGVLHCFGGDPAFAEQCLDWGFYISFAGNVTFPKAGVLREAARVVPMDRLLVETDSPFLAPQPVRGKRCEPVCVRHTAAHLAELKGISLDDLARHTSANARRFYGVAQF